MLRLSLMLLLLICCARAEVVPLASATATYSQSAEYNVSRAIDGNANDTLGWGVTGGQFSTQSAIFRPASPVTAGALQVSLFQNWGSTHWINEFRLSVTSDPAPSVSSAWTTLVPVAFQSSTTQLTQVGDKLRSTGSTPKTIYTIQASAPFAGITAFRLEAFPHDPNPLDAQGPSLGRASNGNFVLTEFAVEANPSATGNIALFRPITASGDLWPTQVVRNLVDGSPSSYTHPFATQETLGFFYELDLGQAWEIDRIVVRNRADGCCPTRLTNYEIQLYDNEPGDEDLGDLLWHGTIREDGTNSGVGGSDTITASMGVGAFRGRYLRLINRSNATHNPQAAEIEVYASLRPVIHSFLITGDDNLTHGQSTTLSWSVGNVASVTITPDVGVVPATGAVTVSPTGNTTYTLTATSLAGTASASVNVGVNVPMFPPQIVEIAADQNQLEDEDGETPDWIELYNPNGFRLALGGFRIGDSSEQWSLPNLTLQPGTRLLLFASGKDRSNPSGKLHTNFSLNKNGETLTIRNPGGSSAQVVAYPEMRENISYGRASSVGAWGFFKIPTPGQPNGALTYSGLVGETNASVQRGFFSAPFSVTLSSETPGTQIRYTLNGASPTATTGAVYSAPIPVTTSTILRAASFRTGWAPSNTITKTYLFPAAVLAQPAAPPGFPTTWTDSGNTVPADYEMDPAITHHSGYMSQMQSALTSIRTLSVVMDPADIFGTNGLYMNPQQRGIAWERATSIELLLPPDASHPAGRSGFQENCGIRIFGYGWRSHNASLKHSFRLKFKDAYDGPAKLGYPLFPGWPVERFDNLILRAQGSRGWNDFRLQDIRQTQYIHDTFARDSALAMGKADAPATYVHLYLNGLYWGLYNIVPRPDASFAEEHFGGDDADYDALNSRLAALEVVDGNQDAWDQVQVLAQGSFDDEPLYAQLQQLVDVDNLIDYVIYNIWAMNHDGPANQNNFRAIRKRAPDGRWRFYFWDMEYTLWDADENTFSNVAGVGRTVWPLFEKLTQNANFRLLFADRIHRHCFNNGALTPAAAIARWDARATEIYTAVLAESARWGDVRREPPYTRDTEWAAERTRLTGTYFPQRTGYFLTHARSRNLYPSVAAPALNQFGGVVAPSFQATLSAPAGAIYYTADGSDPRSPTGGIAGTPYTQPFSLVNGRVTVKARTLQGSVWSALTEAEFSVGVAAPNGAKIVFSEIHYHPAENGLEFIELMNVGQLPVDLSGCRFTRGIDYTFPGATVIPAGARIVLTSEDFEGDLSNAGETVTLTLPDSITILREVTYETTGLWPEAADGYGPSLTLLRPEQFLAGNLPAHWRASTTPGGSPGSSDATHFVGSVMTDMDGDGLCALVEYALGTSDSVPNANPASTYFIGGHAYITFPMRPGADDVECTVETSTDLEHWNDSSSNVEPVSISADVATWRVLSKHPNQYLRVRARQR